MGAPPPPPLNKCDSDSFNKLVTRLLSSNSNRPPGASSGGRAAMDVLDEQEEAPGPEAATGSVEPTAQASSPPLLNDCESDSFNKFLNSLLKQSGSDSFRHLLEQGQAGDPNDPMSPMGSFRHMLFEAAGSEKLFSHARSSNKRDPQELKELVNFLNSLPPEPGPEPLE